MVQKIGIWTASKISGWYFWFSQWLAIWLQAFAFGLSFFTDKVEVTTLDFLCKLPWKLGKKNWVEGSWKLFHCKSAKRYNYGGNYIYVRWKLGSPGMEIIMLLQYRAQRELQNPPRTWAANLLLCWLTCTELEVSTSIPWRRFKVASACLGELQPHFCL